jgi:uncharacterized protein YhaN
MKIRDVQVGSFGVWHDLSLANLSEQVTVFYGPNEAGKTTLLQFIRAQLYGFTDERRQTYLTALGGRTGGSLAVNHLDRSYTITRWVDGPHQFGDPTVNDGHTPRRGQPAISELLGGVDEATFSRVFAVGLREIQELGSLNDGEAAHLLYDLTLGLDRVSLSEIVGHLNSERSDLLGNDDKPGIVSQLLSRRERLHSEIQQLSELTPRYLEMVNARDALAAEIARLDAERGEILNRAQILEAAKGLQPRWLRRGELAKQVAALPPHRRIADDLPTRLTELRQRHEGLKKQLDGIRERRSQLRHEIEQLNINEALARSAPRLEALNEQQAFLETLSGQSEQIKRTVADLETQLTAHGKQFETKLGRTLGPKVSPATLANLRAQARSVREVREKHRAAAARFEHQQKHKDAFVKDAPAVKDRPTGERLKEMLESAGQLVSQLRRRIQVEDRLDQQERKLKDLGGVCQDLLSQQVLPQEWLIGIGFFFILGVFFILKFLFGHWFSAATGGHVPELAIGLVMMIVSLIVKNQKESADAEELDAAQQQHGKLREQVRDLKAEQSTLDAQLPRGAGLLPARLQAAERDLADLQAIVPVEAKRGEIEQVHGSAREEFQQLAATYKRELARWQQLLVGAGLPENLSPKEVFATLEKGDQQHGLRANLEAQKLELQEKQRQFGLLSARVAQFAAEVGLPAHEVSPDPVVLLATLTKGLREQEQKLKRRTALQGEIARLRHKHREISRTAGKVLRKHRGILRGVGANDEPHLRRIMDTFADHQRLRHEHESLVADVDRTLMSHEAAETIGQLLLENHNFDLLLSDLNTSLASFKQQSDQLLEKRGEMNQKLKSLAEDTRLAEKHLELSTVEQQLHDNMDKWRVLAASSMIVEQVRQKYEQDRQPETLREATVYLNRFTDGRYTRVWTPLGANVLNVDDAQGHSLPVEQLSRGTREQLFLALRMSLVSALAQRGVRIPLVLDDVLVNFDVGRTATAASVLSDFAQAGHQLLLFTCHQHVAKLFKARGSDVRLLPYNDDLHRPVDASWLIDEVPTVLPPPAPIVMAEPVMPVQVMAVPVAQAIFEPDPVPVAAPVRVAAPPKPEVIEPLRKKRPIMRPLAPESPRRTPPLKRPVIRTPWDAEEFSGELRDQVRQDLLLDAAHANGRNGGMHFAPAHEYPLSPTYSIEQIDERHTVITAPGGATPWEDLA